ncbi:MAG: site-2 protease family protein [Thermomicrobiales bacterium]|nr:site-2 protease family protein [Thermomicrobiales bacterium]
MLALQVSRGRDLPEPKVILFILLSFVIATSIHEFMHAYTALQLGDTTARDLGRVTLNPVSHFEPYGFFGMVMISIGYSFIGWGKPVPVNPNRLQGLLGKGVDGRKRAMALVAIAGPISNVVQAAAGAATLRIADRNGTDLGDLGLFLSYFVLVNVLLASFNMIPIPPLDGHKILVGILPNFWYPVLAPLERYGFMILFGLFFVTSWLGLPSITSPMIDPVRDLLYDILF